MLVTDAQVHLWLPKPGDTPADHNRGTEQWPDGHSTEHLLPAMAEAGVDRVVAVPPGDLGSNAQARGFCEQYPDRIKMMGVFNLQAPDGLEQLQGWMAQPHMLGLRVAFNYEPYRTWFDDGSLDWFWDAAERLHIPLMVLAGAMPDRVYRLLERRPGLPIILDHLGRPSRASGAGSWADIKEFVKVARLPHVSLKVTSAPCYSDEPYPFRDIHDHLKLIYDSFGPQRLLWGSDLTRLRGTYRECVLLFQEALPFLSAEDKEWIMGKALAEHLNWPEVALQ